MEYKNNYNRAEISNDMITTNRKYNEETFKLPNSWSYDEFKYKEKIRNLETEIVALKDIIDAMKSSLNEDEETIQKLKEEKKMYETKYVKERDRTEFYRKIDNFISDDFEIKIQVRRQDA